MDNYQDNTDEGTVCGYTLFKQLRMVCLKVSDECASNLRTCPDPTTSTTEISKRQSESKTTQVH
eukprot:4653758-Amphidinium_carterae.1